MPMTMCVKICTDSHNRLAIDMCRSILHNHIKHELQHSSPSPSKCVRIAAQQFAATKGNRNVDTWITFFGVPSRERVLKADALANQLHVFSVQNNQGFDIDRASFAHIGTIIRGSKGMWIRDLLKGHLTK